MADEEKHLICGIDRLEMALISGWARYLDSDEPVDIELVVNEVGVGSFRADEYRHDLVKDRKDGMFAFKIEPGLDSDSMLRCVPAAAVVYLRDSKSKIVLQNSNCVWEGLAPKGQQGICNSAGQHLQIAKGRFVIPLKERTADWRFRILQATKDLCKEAATGGFLLSATYGTLLGAVREQAMIPHDDDVDLMFLATSSSMLEAVHEFKALEDFLKSKGYKVRELTNGQIHVGPAEVNDLSIDLFLGWFENARLNLTFTVHDGPPQVDIIPLSTVLIDGVELPVPNRPESLLEAIYGPGWKTPDPSFQWRRSADVSSYFAPIHNYKRSANVDYWRDYYASRTNVSPPEYPSQFALFMMCLGHKPSLVVDLGCGSGRDSLFLASHGLNVIGLDYVDSAIADNTERALAMQLANKASFMRCDVSDLSDVGTVMKNVSSSRGEGLVCVYSRFFFHAIDENTEGAALLLVSQLLTKRDDFAVFEFRTVRDKDRQRVTPSHYRRYINVDRFILRAQEFYSLKCTYRTEGLGYAIFGMDDAYVARLIFVRT